MVILQVCGFAAVYGGNFIASLLALAKDIEKSGNKMEFLFPETAKDMLWCVELSKSYKVYFAKLNRFSLKTYFQIKRAMRNANIVHSHFELYDMLVVFAAKSNQKVFWHLHDSVVENVDFIHMLINRIQYKYFGKNAMLISTNEYYSEQIVKLGFRKCNLRLLLNCVDFSRLKYNKEDIKYDFLIFGGFYHVKGLDVLLDACRLLRCKKKYKIGIVGYKETWDWINESYADILDLIEFINPQENVSEIYNKAGVFISASRYETFSYSLLEVLYLRKPAIVSAIEGTKWAEKYPTVKVFESENSLNLGHVMEQYLTGDLWFDENSIQETFEDIRNQYSIDNWVKNIERIYYE